MRAIILALLTLLPLPIRAATNVLENDEIRLEVSPQNGTIIHLVDKRTQTDYVADQKQARLFRFLLPKPDFTARRGYGHTLREINAHEQKADSVEVVDGALKIRYSELQVSPQRVGYMMVKTPEGPPLRYPIEVTVTLRLDGSHVRANMQVENRSSEEITDVTFPWLGGLVRTSDGQRAKTVFPSLGQKSPSGAAAFVARLGGAKPYPGLLATSWMNYEFKDKGIGIESQSPPETQHTIVSPGGESGTSIGWVFFPHIAGQNRWTSPDTILHVHGSDWHTIASEHREWYRQKFSPTTNRAFDRAIGFATYRLKKEDNTANWTYAEIPKLVEEAKLAGIRHLVIQGWRAREGPGNPSPFGEIADPHMGGGAHLKALIETLRQQGVELAFAFHPTLINTAAERYKKDALGWTVRSRVQGNQLSTSYIFISNDYPFHDYTVHYWAQIDPASPATDYLLGEAKRLKEEYGFRNLFLRGVGMPSFLSYNQNTAVPPQRTYAVGYERLLGGLRKLYPEGLLLTEGLNDLVNQWGSAGYTWSQTDGAEILALSLPWTPFSNDVEALNYDQANASFARKILINLIVDGGDGTVGRYVDFAKHLKALQGLKESTGPYYGEAEFRDREGVKNIAPDSGIILSTFRNRSSQQAGIVVANLTKEKKTVGFELDESLQAAKGRLYRLTGAQEEFSLSAKSTIDLGPNEVAILAIDPKQ